jgi:iron complex transport system permease protein
LPTRYIIKFGCLILLLILAFFLSLLYGGSESVNVDWDADNFIFRNIRIPKSLTALVAGGALAISGLILQIIFRNPLAGPYVLGISSGAALMVAFSVLAGNTLCNLSDFFGGRTFIVLSAIAGSFFITLLILFVSKKVSSNVVLLLIGLMFSQICGALQTALEYFADPASLKNFVIWGMGSVSNTSNTDLVLFVPFSVICLGCLLFYMKPLNGLLLGENYARNAGINYNNTRFILILISSVLTGVTTAFCGPVAFVGIAVPILSRMIFHSSRQQIHYFSCLLLGSTIMLFADFISHSLIKNVTLPFNMITTFIGAPLVIYLMFKNKHW